MIRKSIKIILSIIIFSFFLFPSFGRCVVNSYGFKEIGTIASESDIINAHYIDNELAFLLEINRNTFAIYNICDPSNCIELDTYGLTFMHDIEIDLDHSLAFITASNGVNIFNYSNPNDLVKLSVYMNYTSSTYIHLAGELLYIGAEEEGVQIVNVSDPYNPVMIGRWDDSIGHIGPLYVIEDYEYDGSISGNGTGNDIDDFAFVQTRLPNVDAPPTILDMKVLNVSDPTNVTFVQVMNIDDVYVGSVPKHLVGELLYFKHYDFGLRIVNFSDPFNPIVLGSYYDEGLFNDFKIVNETIAFIADDGFGLKIIDCTNPGNMVLLSSYEHEWRTIRVTVNEDRIYLATLEGGVRILSPKMREIPIYTPFIIGSLFIGLIISWIAIRKELKEERN